MAIRYCQISKKRQFDTANMTHFGFAVARIFNWKRKKKILKKKPGMTQLIAIDWSKLIIKYIFHFNRVSCFMLQKSSFYTMFTYYQFTLTLPQVTQIFIPSSNTAINLPLATESRYQVTPTGSLVTPNYCCESCFSKLSAKNISNHSQFSVQSIRFLYICEPTVSNEDPN